MNPTRPQIDHHIGVNGTLAEVASFFRVDARTVRRWAKLAKEPLGHWKRGGSLVFGEEDVVAWWVKFHRDGEPLKPGQAEEQARNLWREHIHQVRISDFGFRIAELEQRIKLLEGAPNLSAA